VCNAMGGAVCSAMAGSPQSEVCDNKDNDCDGTIDDGNPDGGGTCSTGLPGVCDPGVMNCLTGGMLQCVPKVRPDQLTEICNTLDDNCDGTVDEGFNLGMPCTAGVGECQVSGTVVCNAMGGTTCSGIPGQPSTEVCDGKDNDCNGVTDDGFNVGDPCMSGI